MIGLDTNILIRHLTQDDARQSPVATDIMENRLTKQEPGFISVVTMVETAWVLESHYEVSREELAAILDGLVRLENTVVEHKTHVDAAIGELREGGADFSDVLIGSLSAQAGCSRTFTFDKRAARLPDFQLAR